MPETMLRKADEKFKIDLQKVVSTVETILMKIRKEQINGTMVLTANIVSGGLGRVEAKVTQNIVLKP